MGELVRAITRGDWLERRAGRRVEIRKEHLGQADPQAVASPERRPLGWQRQHQPPGVVVAPGERQAERRALEPALALGRTIVTVAQRLDRALAEAAERPQPLGQLEE